VQGALRPVPGALGIRVRRLLYRPFFAELASSVAIADGVHIRAPWGIRLAELVSVNFGASLDGQGGLSCGRRVLIGPYSVLQSTEHVPPIPGDNYGGRFAPVSVGAWAIIASHCVITAGTNLGEAALIGAGAVVTHDVGPGETVAGVPARPIGQRATPDARDLGVAVQRRGDGEHT
jgi:putative colanic acid biosynthesis acetyltransferase WcaF